MKTVTAQLANMRKPQRFVVYPRQTADSKIVVQSERAIGEFDPVTGVGVLNWRQSGSKYFYHLSFALGAERYTFPPAFVSECIAAATMPGEEIGAGVVVA